jgi:hypothetical protein
MIDISGIDKAYLIKMFFMHALQHRAKTTSKFFSVMTLPEDKRDAYLDNKMKEVQTKLNDGVTYFDYLDSISLHLDVSGDKLDPKMFDRDYGDGAAKEVVALTRHMMFISRQLREAFPYNSDEDRTPSDVTPDTDNEPKSSWADYCVIL